MFKIISQFISQILVFGQSICAQHAINCVFMSGLCHLDRASNVEMGVECQIFVSVTFLTPAEFYHLGHIQGIIRVH